MKQRPLTPTQEKERAQIARINYKLHHAHHEAQGMRVLVREFGYDIDTHIVSYYSDGRKYGYFVFKVNSEEEMEEWKNKMSKHSVWRTHRREKFQHSFTKLFNVEFNINGRRLRTLYKEWMK